MPLPWFPLIADVDVLKNLSSAGLNALFYLAENYEGNGISSWSYRDMARRLNCTERSAFRGMKALVDAKIGKRNITKFSRNTWIWLQLAGNVSLDRPKNYEAINGANSGYEGTDTVNGNICE